MGKIHCSAALFLPVLLMVAAPARSQEPAMKELPKFFGIFSTTVGGWSEYAVTEIEGGKKSTMRNAIVGKEGDSFWYEVVITEGDARNVIKMSLKGDPNNPENIQRLIMKNGDQPAQEMPREFVMMGRRMATSMFESRSGSSVAEQPGLKSVEVGTREVKVSAGSFTATQNQLVDAAGKVLATYDYSSDVLPLGVVRSETDKVRIELVAYGKDAVSLITEQPQMMKKPPGMPETNPRGTPPGMEAPGTTPAPASGGYGAPAPAPASGGYGTPAPASGGYGTPAPASGGYGAPAPASGGYGAPAPASGGYGAPAPASGGYGAPAPASGGYGK